MAQLQFQFSLALLLFLLHLPFHSSTTTNTTKGFTMRLIHRDSIHSPLYNPNLTKSQRIQSRVQSSNSRISLLNSFITNTTTITTDQIRPTIGLDGSAYWAEVHIGTPHLPFKLQMDTASSIIWLQCRGCQPCEPNSPQFNWQQSLTYFRLPCNDPLCVNIPCINNNCQYTETYAQPATVMGVLASDTFTFASSDRPIEQIEHLGFGCGFSVENFGFPETVSGILGLSKEHASLVSQLPVGTPRRFSYCLLEHDVALTEHSYLRFGEEALLTGDGIWKTPFADGPRGLYYLGLIDISINDTPMNFATGFFDLGPNGGGVIIDSGSSECDLKVEAYNRVEGWLIGYFDHLGLTRIPGRDGLRLCYAAPFALEDLPTMTFHFFGANMFLPVENVFEINLDEDPGYFCLGMLPSPSNDRTILGALQQQNIRFLYDLDQNYLGWHTEECIDNP